MREPQECPNCLYTPGAPAPQKEEEDCNQCFYEVPKEKDPAADDCNQCFYEAPKEPDPKADDCNQCFYTPKK